MVLIDDNSTVLNAGDSMPSFDLPATNGQNITQADCEGKVSVIIFTCNHCPYVHAYDDRIVELMEQFEADGVQFVLISSNDADAYPDDSFENMKVKAEELNYAFPYCYDEKQDIARNFGALCTPHCFVFDAESKLTYKGRVDDNWEDASSVTEFNLHDAIEATVDGREPVIKEANALGCSIKWK